MLYMTDYPFGGGVIKNKELEPLLVMLTSANKEIVFTNGCFDILHCGHIDLLTEARSLGDVLIVGLNSDKSIKRLKGNSRPIIPEDQRARMLSALRPVDYVIIFDEDTPIKLIEKIRPEVLVKGEDWKSKIVGSDFVKSNGGRVHVVKFNNNISTTSIIEKTVDPLSDEILQAAVDKYGIDSQFGICTEEIAELIEKLARTITKINRYFRVRVDTKEIFEEFVDVFMTIKQMRFLNKELFDSLYEQKVNIIKERVKE